MAADDVLRMFTDEGVTFSAGVPTIWQGIRAALEADSTLAEGLQLNRLACGGSAPAAEMMQWYLKSYGVTFLQAWGMTETNPIATVARPVQKAKDLSKTDDERFENIVKAGLAMPGLELKIVDSENLSIDMPQDGEAQGELLARGPTITGDYFKLPEEDREGRFHDGWLVTGDIASIDPDGYLIIRDRSKDLIKSGGEYVVPTLYEPLVSLHL